MNASQKLNDQDLEDIKLALANGERGTDLARLYGVTPAVITQIKKGTRKPNGKIVDKGVFLTLQQAERVRNFMDDVVALYDRGELRITSEAFETIFMFKQKFEAKK